LNALPTWPAGDAADVAGRCSLVWCHPQSRRDEVLSWSDERFCHELQQAFGWRLGRIVHAGKRSVYPLSLTTASRTVAHRLALVGNAAQTLHPIAGQGFNLGLRDVMSLAEMLAQAQAKERIRAAIAAEPLSGAASG
jgi:2-octaprenyl-6-methoxyphenol hydroxylase